jgi:hypothetical protein
MIGLITTTNSHVHEDCEIRVNKHYSCMPHVHTVSTNKIARLWCVELLITLIVQGNKQEYIGYDFILQWGISVLIL